MARRAIKLLTIVSLLACVMVTIQWGNPSDGDACCRTGWHGWGVACDAGGLSLGHCEFDAPKHPAVKESWQWDAVALQDGFLPRLGFGWGGVNVVRPVPMMASLPAIGRLFATSTRGRYVKAPWWVLFVLTAAAPLAWAAEGNRRRWWSERGRCAACGYDLRATPERCPECGASAGMTNDEARMTNQ